MKFLKNILDRITRKFFPSYYDTVKPLKESFYAEEIQSNLPFQMLMYYNVYFYPFWFAGILSSWIWKINTFDINAWNYFQNWVLLVLFFIIEPIRLYLGYFGNEKEKVPDLSGCILFTVFPQLLICFLLLSYQSFFGDGFTTPLEYALHCVYIGFLIPEFLFGYFAARDIVHFQTIGFYSKFEGHSAPKAA